MQKEEFLKKIEIELKISKNSQYTIRNYVKCNSNLLDFCKKLPGEITKEDIKAYQAEKLSDKASSSIVMFLAAIKYAYSGILGKDITAGIKRPKKETRIPAVLTREETTKLIESASNKKSKLMISFLYSSGVRVSELINIKVEDISFNEKIGYVKQGKGRKDRAFSIPEFLINDLKEQVEKQKSNNQEYLFSGPKGRLSDRNIQKIVRLASKKAGINKKVSCHTLRHSFATHLLDSGVDIRYIQTLLGHKDLSTTQIYTHISTENIKKIKNPLDFLMEENEKKKSSFVEKSQVTS